MKSRGLAGFNIPVLSPIDWYNRFVRKQSGIYLEPDLEYIERGLAMLVYHFAFLTLYPNIIHVNRG